MKDYEFKWSLGNLQSGFASYAEHLGLKPQEVVFMNSLVVDPNGATWRMTATDDLEGVSTAYVLSMSGKDATALHFPLTNAHQSYAESYLADGGNLHAIEPVGEGRRYPEASIITALSAQVENPAIYQMLAEKTLINSYVTEEVEQLAQKVGARTLMSNKTFLEFVGKEYLHQVAQETGFDAPPGVVITDPEQTNQKVTELQKTIKNLGLNAEATKIWIKPTSLSGGQGVISKPNAKTESIAAAFGVVAQSYKDCGFFEDNTTPLHPTQPFAGISRFMPIVMEVDVGKLPDVKRKLDDVSVHAIISDKGVTYLETAPFDAPNGEYLGSRLPQKKDEPHIYPVKVAADKLTQRMWQEGYRGYMGVDAIVVEQKNGVIKAYLNDVNTRLCGVTPLIGLAHKAEANLGFRPHAYSTKCKIALPENCTDAFGVVADRLNGHIYRGAETEFAGIVPTVVDVPPNSNTAHCRVVAIGHDAKQLKGLRKVLNFGNGH